MDTYLDNIRSDAPLNAGQPPLPTWCAFALGGIVTFLFVYVGIGRPAAHELAQLRRQMGTLEQSVWEVAGQEKAARSTNDLLSQLREQKAQAAAAREALAEIKQLHAQLLAESNRVEQAMVAVSQLGAIKDMLLSNADRADQAAAVLAVSEDLQHRLANAADSTELALEASHDLLDLQADLLAGSQQSATAHATLDQLIEIRARLDLESLEVAEAQDQVTELISLKDKVVSQTKDLKGAIETLELTNELGLRFHEAALSFEQIRHWMIEVTALEPMLQRAKATLDPLLEMGNLERLSPDALRSLARQLCQQGPTMLARKPASPAPPVANDVDASPSAD